MLSEQEATERVARGVAYLDRIDPQWFTRINLGTLRLSSGCLCILGQLVTALHLSGWGELLITRGKSAGMSSDELLTGEPLGCYYEEAATAEDRKASYALLQDAWIEVIADRVLAAAQEPTQAEAVGAVVPVLATHGQTSTRA